jgi:hypothetical protein
MSECQAYPCRRVIIGFTLCPALVSVFMVLGDISNSIFLQGYSLPGWEAYPVFMLVVSAVALMFYGVPALMLALLYAAVRPYKSFGAYVFVFLSGGLGAHLWGLLINYLNSHSTQDFPGLPGLGPYGIFFLAATTSLVMAYIVLPNQAKDGSNGVGSNGVGVNKN